MSEEEPRCRSESFFGAGCMGKVPGWASRAHDPGARTGDGEVSVRCMSEAAVQSRPAIGGKVGTLCPNKECFWQPQIPPMQSGDR